MRWVEVPGTGPRRGGNGIVTQVTDATGEYTEFAAKKTLSAGSLHRYDRFRREVRIAMEYKHEHLAPLIDSYLPEVATAEDLPFLVMPWFDGGTLQDRVDRGEYSGRVAEGLRATRPLLTALATLHENGIAHRDIKPRNILFQHEQPILADFGLCFDVDDIELTLTSEVVGSQRYRAPEYLDGRLATRDHTPGDVFSFGKTLWAALAGKEPVDGPISAYPEQNLVAIHGDKSLAGAQELIQHATLQDRKHRPNVSELLNEFDFLLAPSEPEPKDVAARMADARAQLHRFARTDPTLAARSRIEAGQQGIAAEVQAVLKEIRSELESLEAVRAWIDEFPGRSEGTRSNFSFFLFGPEIHSPSADLSAQLGFAVTDTNAVGFMLVPPSSHWDELPTLVAVWAITVDEESLTGSAYAYRRDAGPTRALPGGKTFKSRAGSVGLRRTLSQLIPPQLLAFADAVNGLLAR